MTWSTSMSTTKEPFVLVYMYFDLAKGCMWMTKQMTDNCTLLTIIYLHLLVFVCSFYNTFATPLLIIHMYHFCLGSSNTSHSYPASHVLQPILRICHTLLHSSRLERIRRHRLSKCILTAW